MTPKEKALDLVKIFQNQISSTNNNYNEAIQCSLIAVDEITQEGNNITSLLLDGYEDFEFNNYWNEVRKELDNL